MTDTFDRLKSALADRYEIEQELGAGGMATVYLARDLKHERRVAVKVLRPELAASIGVDRFLREIKIAANLNHPHILPLHDSGEADDSLFYVMPYVEGESLRDRLNREKQLPVDEALRITGEISDGLAHAHSLGIVHRDIKPENILFTAGHAVVSDFGIARAVSAAGAETLTETGLAVGTPAYMSPEQAAGDKDIDSRSDLYSLGCVLYEMLSGEAPYMAPTAQAIIAKKLSEPTPRISVVREAVPVSVEAALTKALSKTPADRFGTAQQLVDALETGVPADRVGRHSAWYWGAGLAVVAALVAVGVALLENGASGADPEFGAGGTERVVVAPFENRTGDPVADDWDLMAAEFITRSIDRAGELTVVPASAVRDLMREVDETVGLSVNEIASRMEARYAVAGSYSTQGDRVRFDVELIDAESGEMVRALAPVTGSVDSLEGVMADLAERVTVATLALLSLDVNLFTSWSPPPSLEVFRTLMVTQDAFCRMRWRDVIDQARPALRQAPDYAPLLVMAVFSYANLGRMREADSVFTLLEPLMDGLTTSERLLVEWGHGWFYGNRAEETGAVEQLFRIQPGNYGVHAGWTALRANRIADALERLLAYDVDAPCNRAWPWPREVTAQAYHLLGQYEEELAVARRGLERFPSYRPLILFEAIALAGLDRMEALDSLLDVINELPPQQRAMDTYNPGSQTAYIALELRVLGKQEASEAVIDRALTWFVTRPSSELRFERAKVLYWAGRWSDADTLFAALIEEFPDNPDYRAYRGVALAHLGRWEAAAETARWLAQLDRSYLGLRQPYTRWRAAIAAALGDREEAVRLLKQAYREGMRLGYYHRRDPEWEPLLDYRPYQEFVKPKR